MSKAASRWHADVGGSGDHGIGRRIAAYGASADPRTALANFVALLVASSQPVYPLYLYWTVSETIWPSLVTFLSMPFFLAVPALARRHDRAGRALMVLAGIGNTLLCAKAFGVASGVEVFLIPCALLALVLFRPSERWTAWPLAALALGPYLLLHDRYGAPLHPYTAEEYAAFARLNFMSAASVVVLVGYRLAGLLGENDGAA